MDFEVMIQNLNEVLTSQEPQTFCSSWILKHAPGCYRFIRKAVRTDWGAVDWDRVTRALKPRFQSRWMPQRIRQCSAPYRNHAEVRLVLKKYRKKLYVFLAPQDATDRHYRDLISITLVRLAQHGNTSAKQEIMNLVSYIIEDWMDGYSLMSRWRGREAEVRVNLERCIRRYRYTGSFLAYVHRTLMCAARGIRPILTCSFEESLFDGSVKRCDRI
jgi:hypothetical protein